MGKQLIPARDGGEIVPVNLREALENATSPTLCRRS
jgi:hypothetical protein